MNAQATKPHEQIPAGPTVQVELCVPEHMQNHVPKRRRAPTQLPHGFPIPRVGEVVYLSSTSAWGVALILHRWRSPQFLRVEIWLEYVGGAHRAHDFPLTQ